MGKILIFSRPIRSGKTTELMECLPLLGKVGGILCPDKNELRWLYSIAKNVYYPLQSEATISNETLEIGRFHFLNTGFEQARACLLEDANGEYDWVLVDEVGKLEFQRKMGLEPAFSELVEHYKSPATNGNLLVVVRDFLVEDFKAYYGLEDAPIINDLRAWLNR